MFFWNVGCVNLFPRIPKAQVTLALEMFEKYVCTLRIWMNSRLFTVNHAHSSNVFLYHTALLLALGFNNFALH